jgi:hypothetical protein
MNVEHDAVLGTAMVLGLLAVQHVIDARCLIG